MKSKGTSGKLVRDALSQNPGFSLKVKAIKRPSSKNDESAKDKADVTNVKIVEK